MIMGEPQGIKNLISAWEKSGRSDRYAHELVQRADRGDKDAQEALSIVIYRILDSLDEDLRHSVWKEIHVRCKSRGYSKALGGGTRLKTYIRIRARWRDRDTHRYRQKTVLDSTQRGELKVLMPSLEHRLALLKILEFVASWPRPQDIEILQLWLQGFKWAEIADRLGEPQTAHDRLRRRKDRLVEQIREHMFKFTLPPEEQPAPCPR